MSNSDESVGSIGSADEETKMHNFSFSKYNSIRQKQEELSPQKVENISENMRFLVECLKGHMWLTPNKSSESRLKSRTEPAVSERHEP
jgi:hypothetical protein